MCAVTLEGVTKRYDSDGAAVRDLSLSIAAGELLAVVGPSGCGKTTLLRMISGLECVTEGTIQIAGRCVDGLPPHQRGVAMVFQQHALYPHLSVYQNLAFGLKMRGWSRAAIEPRVRETAQQVGLEGMLNRAPETLSGGESQRVALGRALAGQPDVLLLDEPLSDLDARGRLDLRRMLKRLQNELRVTTIYVTHDQEEAMALGDRIAVMADGQIEQCGPPREVYCHPKNRFVAQFIGQPPMNLIEGRIERVGEPWYFHAGAFRVELPPEQVARYSIGEPRQVVLGLRPEAIAIALPSELRQACEGRIELIESLGAVMNVHVCLPQGPTLVARIPWQTLREGDEVRLTFDPSDTHWFTIECPQGRD